RCLGPIAKALAIRGWTGTPGAAQPSLAPVSGALDRMERAAADFAAARDAALAAPNALSKSALSAANDALKQVEHAMTRPEGLRTRPWFRNLVYAADEDNGYANIPLPSVSEAVRAGDLTLVTREIADLASRIDAATAALGRATAAL